MVTQGKVCKVVLSLEPKSDTPKFGHSFIDSFTQYTFIEHLLCGLALF